MRKLRKRGRIYLDIAAGVSGNPSSPHTEGREARTLLERARTTIARLVESKSDDIIFTGGATSANALAVLGTIRAARMAGLEHPHALYYPGSHASIVENMRIAESEGAILETLPVKDARIDCEALAKLLRPETVLISIEAVCGETGVVWNTHDMARTLGVVRQGKQNFAPSDTVPSRRNFAFPAGPLLHVDASQAAWTEKLTRAHFGADLLTLDASKVSVARGVGCLIAPRSVPLVGLYGGGGQERALSPGSEAPILASVFAEGLVRAVESRESFRSSASAARAQLIASLQESLPDLLVNESTRAQAPHILNISLPGRDTDYLLALLDEAGFAVSTVSACETASPEPSRAVFALTGERARAAATLRISWGPKTRVRDLARFTRALVEAVRFVDSTGHT